MAEEKRKGKNRGAGERTHGRHSAGTGDKRGNRTSCKKKILTPKQKKAL